MKIDTDQDNMDEDETDGKVKEHCFSPTNNMEKRKCVALVIIYFVYLLIGSGIFYSLEYSNEQKEINMQNECNRNISIMLMEMKERVRIKNNITSEVLEDFLSRIDLNTCFEIPENKTEKWSLFNSFIFSFISVTTIGYGNQAPSSTGGKMVFIFYCLVGIPLSGYLIATLGDYCTTIAAKASRMLLKGRPAKYSFIVIEVVIFTVVGMVVFLGFPAWIFVAIEDSNTTKWEYIDGLYFSFVTLSTIGFGDLLAGEPKTKPGEKPWIETPLARQIYQIFIIIWTMFGLGYIYMMISILQQGIEEQVFLPIIDQIELLYRTKLENKDKIDLNKDMSTNLPPTIEIEDNGDHNSRASNNSDRSSSEKPNPSMTSMQHNNLDISSSGRPKYPSMTSIFNNLDKSYPGRSKYPNMAALKLHQYFKTVNENVLEETSVADLLTAIENVHGHSPRRSPLMMRKEVGLKSQGRNPKVKRSISQQESSESNSSSTDSRKRSNTMEVGPRPHLRKDLI